MKKITVSMLMLFSVITSAQKLKKDIFHIPGHENVEEYIGYNHAVKVGKTVYISGTVNGMTDDMESQLKAIYQRLNETLENYGITTENVVKEVIYTTNLDEFKTYIPLRKEFYKGNYPTATWVQVDRLFIPKLTVEIELVAVLP
ncbi:MAG: Rid family hydrolase [Bacteroidota bacterium]